MAEDTKTKEVTATEVTKAMEQTTVSEEVVLKTKGGEVFKGKNWEEVAQKAAQAKEDTGTAVRDREGQVRDLQTKISDLQRATEERRETTKASTSPQFGQQTFLTQVETDAPEAIASALAHSLGFNDSNELRAFVTRTGEATESYIENYHIARFTQKCPDYPGGKEASDEMFKRLKAQNLDATADNMRITWMEIKDEGKIKPLEISDQETAVTPRTPAPTHLEGTGGGGGGGMTADEEMMSKFDNMTVEQQEVFMKSPEYAALVERTQKQ